MNENSKREYIVKLVNSYIAANIRDDEKRVKRVYQALHILLNGNYVKYDFDKFKEQGDISKNLSLQTILGKINEKETRRKDDGVYYTPTDLTEFIVFNSFLQSLGYEYSNKLISSEEDFIKKVAQLDTNKLLFEKSIFDPTCGAGEFLITAFEIKCKLLETIGGGNDKNYLKILATLYGNDINEESIEITKIRLFLLILMKINEFDNYDQIVCVLNCNLSHNDFVNVDYPLTKFDIIVGNPPYVECSKASVSNEDHYGNIYANVLKNSILSSSKQGVLGLIIPLSYNSTMRMKKIRKFIENEMNEQCVLSFADRPDCLFPSVHQKLIVLFAKRGSAQKKLFTSSYNYWHKGERDNLFKEISIVENDFSNEMFYPKLGSSIEKTIYAKVYTETKKNILDTSLPVNGERIFLNMRGCFWIKAFDKEQSSKEYKEFRYNEKIKNYVLCVLNSSLFFFFWNAISDCWHITSKELVHFYLPIPEETKIFDDLSYRLMDKLEKTKKHIGSKQIEYEYKHRMCKEEIDLIDDHLQSIYNLSAQELNYIKAYALQYRDGGNYESN